MLIRSDLVHNTLLGSLPSETLSALQPKLSLIALPNRKQLYDADGPIDAVYFVESGMISIVAALENGMQAEVGVVGREGMLGISAVSGLDVSMFDTMVQIPGAAWRMGVSDFHRELALHPPLQAVLLRYYELLHDQTMQTAVCNGNHGLEQRLARWLLMAHDRSDGDQLPLTQDLLAMMLGVHRPSVTVTAGILQRAGLIRYSAGRITVIDRAGLETAACECYSRVQRRQETLLGPGDVRGLDLPS